MTAYISSPDILEQIVLCAQDFVGRQKYEGLCSSRYHVVWNTPFTWTFTFCCLVLLAIHNCILVMIHLLVTFHDGYSILPSTTKSF